MNELQVFSNPEFGQVRSVMIEDAPWFVGRDVAGALGYAKAQNALKSHVDSDDALIQGIMDSRGRTQQTTIINESGLYSLILSSKLPSAKRFKRWVTSEILPTLRKTGRYEAVRAEATPERDELPERALTHDDYIRAASIVATCRNERLPYVLAYLKKAGIDALSGGMVNDTVKPERDKYEVMRLLIKAHGEYGISDAEISKQTGLSRKQISMYRTGERFPRVGRAEFIKAVIEPMVQ